METIWRLFIKAGGETLVSLSHNWPYLLASVLVAAGLKAIIDADKVSAFLSRTRGLGILAATGTAVATPLCSCGTTAVILGMMAGSIPLAPIVAFMVASPLSSPSELIYSAGLFGWPFAIAYFSASIALGVAGGGIAAALEKKGLLKGQARLRPAGSAAPGANPGGAACGGHACAAPRRKPRELLASYFGAASGAAKSVLPLYVGFAFVGYLINAIVPSDWISQAFGSGHAWGVPLAATVGLPLYVSSEASLPMIRAFIDSGMGRGSAMAFMIAGSGTSIGAIAGALTIARWKVVGLVVATLWLGAIISGWAFDLLASIAAA